MPKNMDAASAAHHQQQPQGLSSSYRSVSNESTRSRQSQRGPSGNSNNQVLGNTLSSTKSSQSRRGQQQQQSVASEPDQDHVLKLLEGEECSPETLAVFTRMLQAMVDRVKRGEDDPEDQDEMARAERLTIALDGNAHKGVQVLHAVVAVSRRMHAYACHKVQGMCSTKAMCTLYWPYHGSDDLCGWLMAVSQSPAARKYAHLAELAVTVLTYMSTVRPLRNKVAGSPPSLCAHAVVY
jgi:hypothetical protein